MKKFTFYLIAAVSFLLFSCSSNEGKSGKERKTIFVKGATNNKLELLDWGGDGQPILFLAGLGNTAHVFNDFAPRFTDKFHVLGLTRRGFGKSEQSTGYDLTALTGDILSVLDSLQIKKVVLAGHSVAGEEITKFAGLYPDRVDKIIYLDAAYDRMGMDSLFSDSPAGPQPTTEDSASIENLKKFYTANYGLTVPDEEIRETSVFSKDGRYVKDATAMPVVEGIIAGTIHPEYDKVKCPALAIYAVIKSAKEMLPFYSKLDSVNVLKADRLFLIVNKKGAEERETFRKKVANSTVKEIIGGDHYLFISHPAEVEKMMRDFL